MLSGRFLSYLKKKRNNWPKWSLVVPLVVIRCNSRCHSFSLVVIRCTSRCHSLYHALSFIVTRCHSLSLVVPIFVTRCHSMYYWSIFLQTIVYPSIFCLISISCLFNGSLCSYSLICDNGMYRT